jgi:hypothetical protein
MLWSAWRFHASTLSRRELLSLGAGLVENLETLFFFNAVESIFR